MTKNELRKTYLARQMALSPAERAEKSGRIAQHFFESANLSKAALLHCFIPIDRFNEVDAWRIILPIWTTEPRLRVAVPRLSRATGEIESIVVTAKTELVENKWGIREPADGETIGHQTIDAVIVPGITFDRAGHRVGYGKGLYDRFLRTCRDDCDKIGVSYFEPVNAISDIYDGDTALGHVITPDGIFTAETRRKEDLATDRRG